MQYFSPLSSPSYPSHPSFPYSCLLAGLLATWSCRAQRSGARPLRFLVLFFFPWLDGWLDGLMDGWMVQGRLVPSVHPFCLLLLLPLIILLPLLLLVCLLGCLERDEARPLRYRFLFLLLLWLDTTCEVPWRSVGGIGLSDFLLLGCSSIF